MNREEILQASRNENKNKDLAELEVVYQASVHAARVGALVCCMVSALSSALAHAILYSPWVIYFSIFTTQWLVRFLKIRRRSVSTGPQTKGAKRRHFGTLCPEVSRVWGGSPTSIFAALSGRKNSECQYTHPACRFVQARKWRKKRRSRFLRSLRFSGVFDCPD